MIDPQNGRRADDSQVRDATTEAPDWTAVRSEYLLDQRLAGLSPKTVEVYGVLISHYERWCQAEGVALVSSQRLDVGRYMAEQIDRSPGETAYHRLVGLRSFYRWAKKRGLREDEPTEGIKVKRPKQETKQPLTDDELRAILAACRTLRERALILCFIATGARRSEIAGMTTDDLREDGMLLIRGKGNKERWAHLGKTTYAALVQYLDGREGAVWLADHPLTPSPYRGGPIATNTIFCLLRRIAKRAGVSDVYPHRLRVTFANRWLDLGYDLVALQGRMGHANLEMTAHYSRYNADRRGLEMQQTMVDSLLSDDKPPEAVEPPPVRAPTPDRPASDDVDGVRDLGPAPALSNLQERMAERGWAVVR